MSEIGEIWDMMFSNDENTRSEGHRQYVRFHHDNPLYSESYTSKLTPKFLSRYNKYNFHDFHILNIRCRINRMLEKEVSLLLHDYHEDYGKDLYFVLVYRNVRACRLSLEPTNYAINWARDIFEDIGDGYLLHRIMCSDDIRIDIEFSDVSLSAPKNIRRHNS